MHHSLSASGQRVTHGSTDAKTLIDGFERGQWSNQDVAVTSLSVTSQLRVLAIYHSAQDTYIRRLLDIMLTAQRSTSCPAGACAFSSNCLRPPAPTRCRGSSSRVPRLQRQRVSAGIELDWSDPDTLTGAFAAVLGIAVGIGAPLFYISRDKKDDQRLEDLRELNRQNYKETGKYLTDVKPLLQPTSMYFFSNLPA